MQEAAHPNTTHCEHTAYARLWYWRWSLAYRLALVAAWCEIVLNQFGQQTIAMYTQRAGLIFAGVMSIVFISLFFWPLIQRINLLDDEGRTTNPRLTQQLKKQGGIHGLYAQTSLFLLMGLSEPGGGFLIFPIFLLAIITIYHWRSSSTVDHHQNTLTAHCSQKTDFFLLLMQLIVSIFLSGYTLLTHFCPSLPDLTGTLPMKIIFCTVLASACAMLIKSTYDINQENDVSRTALLGCYHH
jgi:hypothetical protein